MQVMIEKLFTYKSFQIHQNKIDNRGFSSNMPSTIELDIVNIIST